VAGWRFARRLTPERRRRFRDIFGKLQLTYTPTRIRGVLGHYRCAPRYHVLATDPDSVAIRHEEQLLGGAWLIEHIHFDGANRYGIAVGGHREWSRKLRPAAA